MISKLREKLAEINADCALFFKKSDIFYFTGLDTCGVLIVKKKEVTLFYPATEREILKSYTPGEIELVEYISAVPWQELSGLLRGQTAAFGFGETEFKKYCLLDKICKDIVDLKGFAGQLRAIKNSREIEYIKKAQAHCLEFTEAFCPQEWVGRTEAELAGRLSALTWEGGMSGPSFTPIVSGVKNSSSPHHVPGEDRIQGLLMIDFGARYKGYCSDLTRTFILDKFIKTFNTHKLYESLENAKEKAASLLRPGVSCGQIYSAAKESLEKDGLDKYFIHSLGHGVGLDIHERPYLKAGSKEILKEGMVLTVEPGIYIKEAFGMRTEDIYLITGEGRQKLNRKFR